MMNDLKMFAIAGDPALHTRSPLMFSAAFDALHMQSYRYLRLSASRADEVIAAMRELPISAFNITSPFKEDIIPLLDNMDENARKIGAVNAVCNEKGSLRGHNTDVIGVEAAFRRKNIPLMGRKAVVLGAGGAAKAAIQALMLNGADVVVVNRTLNKAVQLASTFSCRAAALNNIFQEVASADILVSCLPGGVDVLPDSVLRSGLFVLDANYGERAVVAQKSLRCGCIVIDGLEWLIGQGIAAFTLFTGVTDPPVDAIREGALSGPVVDKSNIALIGFMGAGKSVVGRHLSKIMKFPLIDIDSQIEKRCGASIKDIFEEQGEEVFRRMELSEMEKTADLNGSIISCGGGAVLNRRAVETLKRRSIVVWLWSGTEAVMRRIKDNTSRPLLKSCDRKSKIEEMLMVRNPAYAEASDIFIHTDDKAPEEIAKRIERESSQFLRN